MTLTIGQVAAAAAVNIQTIRYYERRGLFTTPRRSPSGYRQYAQDAVTRLRFIKHAQELGFSLKDVQELLALRVRHGAACDTAEQTTRQKIELVQRKMRDLERIRDTLEELAAACASRRPTDDCPILEALDDRDVPAQQDTARGRRRTWMPGSRAHSTDFPWSSSSRRSSAAQDSSAGRR